MNLAAAASVLVNLKIGMGTGPSYCSRFENLIGHLGEFQVSYKQDALRMAQKTTEYVMEY